VGWRSGNRTAVLAGETLLDDFSTLTINRRAELTAAHAFTLRGNLVSQLVALAAASRRASVRELASAGGQARGANNEKTLTGIFRLRAFSTICARLCIEYSA